MGQNWKWDLAKVLSIFGFKKLYKLSDGNNIENGWGRRVLDTKLGHFDKQFG